VALTAALFALKLTAVSAYLSAHVELATTPPTSAIKPVSLALTLPIAFTAAAAPIASLALVVMGQIRQALAMCVMP
jgi:hypothetical protein